MNRILIVEDESHLAEGLRFNLEAEGYQATIEESGDQALALLAQPEHGFDLMVLDVMLPGLDGFSVIAGLREQGVLIPTLMLTARSRPEDILRGFEAGADDYLAKPFELTILIARIRSLLRRTAWAQKQAAPPARDVFEFAGKTIDFDNLQLRVGGESLQLTLMEANLLRFLIDREGQAVSRAVILDKIWGLREDTDTRAIDNFIVRLRRHIEDEPTSPKHLMTVRGVGYRFVSGN
ncbi:MAG: response regulator transcription factor [Bryobacteraceae bacterium]|nr:response regulator transcription factor [Bryobacteraceae bacterium]